MNNKTEKILNSLEGLQKAAAPNFFYTRLKARMQKELQEQPKAFLLLNPAFISISLFVLLIANVFSVVSIKKGVFENATVQKSQPANLQTFAEAYNLKNDIVYE